MGDSPLLSKVIKVKEVTSKDGQGKKGSWKLFRVTDQDNNKYSFFATKIDGTDRKAYASFKQLGVTIDSDIEIVYKEEPAIYKDKNGQDHEYMQREIVLINPVTVDMSQPIPEKPKEDEIQVENIPF